MKPHWILDAYGALLVKATYGGEPDAIRALRKETGKGNLNPVEVSRGTLSQHHIN